MSNLPSPRGSQSDVMEEADDVTTASPLRVGGAVTSKDVLVMLLEAWTPQLSASYRPSVEYEPSDMALYCRLFGNHSVRSVACTLAPSPSAPSPAGRKFKVAEHVVSACQHFQKIDKIRSVFRKSAD